MLGRILQKFADWALAKNAPGGYAGEDDRRWAYTIETDGDPYLTRILLPRVDIPWLGISFRPMIHKFHRADGDQALHSHPWTRAFSIILSGAYVEERLESIFPNGKITTTTKLVRFFNYLTGDDYHRVKELRGDVWTLFVTGERSQDWGFLVDGEHVPWTTFLGKDGAQ